jgi:hypothetical protein
MTAKIDRAAARVVRLRAALAAAEDSYLLAAIEAARGNRAGAMALLGMPKRTFYNRLQSPTLRAKVDALCKDRGFEVAPYHAPGSRKSDACQETGATSTGVKKP